MLMWTGPEKHASAQINDYKTLRVMEKISLTLTGAPLTDELRAKALLAGPLSAEELVVELAKTDAFVRHFGKFWAQKIGVTNIGNGGIYNMLRKNSGQSLRRYANGVNIVRDFSNDGNRQPSSATLLDWANQIRNRKGRLYLTIKNCPGNTYLINHLTVRLGRFKTVVDSKKYIDGSALKAPLERYQTLYNLGKTTDPACADTSNIQDVKPFWDPSGTYKWKAAKYLTTNDRCKSDLSACERAETDMEFYRGVSQDSNLEPGLLIAKTVSDEIAFSSIFTNSRTVLSERYAFLMQKENFPLWPNFPGGKYKEDKEPKWLKPSPQGKSLFWVDRSPEHAGVLTTPVYNTLTNGRRAKANRAFEAFLCKKFVVPEGAVPDPSDANPDLRKRKYCAYCHRTLEPMAAFWNRYPALGRVNLEYNADPNIDDRGFFDGKQGAGVKKFGEILGQSKAFQSCSVKRTFEFIYGRMPTLAEEKTHFPAWIDVFNASNQNVLSVIIAMMKHKSFSQSWEESK